MKKLPIILLLIVSTTVFAKINNKTEYQIKSAYIKYEITGFDHGYSEVLFDNYGKKESVYSEIILQVNDSEMKTMIGTIKKNTQLFTLNFASRTYFSENIEKKDAKSENKRSENKIDNAFSELDEAVEEIENEEKNKQQLIGTETVLDKKCDVLRVHDGVIWVYKGIILRQIKFLNKDKIIYEAIAFEENPEISNSAFDVPEGFMVVENPMNRLHKSSN